MNTAESIVDLKSLASAIDQGYSPNYLFFWGHHPPTDGGINQSCLSQWFPANFEINGIRYSTAEQYMMATKARLFDDLETEQQILSAKNPAKAKKLGRMVENFNEDTWNQNRFQIVVEANIAKFTQNKQLGQYLKSTCPRILVEASPVDPIWGIGLAANAKEAHQPGLWRGLNLLGFALMQTRNQLLQH